MAMSLSNDALGAADDGPGRAMREQDIDLKRVLVELKASVDALRPPNLAPIQAAIGQVARRIEQLPASTHLKELQATIDGMAEGIHGDLQSSPTRQQLDEMLAPIRDEAARAAAGVDALASMVDDLVREIVALREEVANRPSGSRRRRSQEQQPEVDAATAETLERAIAGLSERIDALAQRGSRTRRTEPLRAAPDPSET
jgi:hypothetical protein